MPQVVRMFVLALVIVATLGISAASTTHIDSSPNGCSLCFIAHTVAYEMPSAQPFCGLEMVGRTQPALPVIGYLACDTQPSCSRGPPLASA
jgi:hypothetical protein